MQHEKRSLTAFSQVHNKATTKGGSDMEVWKDIRGQESENLTKDMSGDMPLEYITQRSGKSQKGENLPNTI